MLTGFRQFISESIDERYALKAVYMAGGPGVGKSSVAHEMFAGLGFRKLNPDIMFEFLSKKYNVSMKAPGPMTPLLHGRSKSTVVRQKADWTQNQSPILIDTTGRDYNKITTQAEALRDLGYDTYMVFVQVDRETAWARNQTRQRTVLREPFDKLHDAVQNNIEAYRQYFGENFVVVDNNQKSQNLRSLALHLLSKSSPRRLQLLAQGRRGLTNVQGRSNEL